MEIVYGATWCSLGCPLLENDFIINSLTDHDLHTGIIVDKNMKLVELIITLQRGVTLPVGANFIVSIFGENLDCMKPVLTLYVRSVHDGDNTVNQECTFKERIQHAVYDTRCRYHCKCINSCMNLVARCQYTPWMNHYQINITELLIEE